MGIVAECVEITDDLIRFAACPVTARAFVKVSQPHLSVIALWYLWLIGIANAVFGGSFRRGKGGCTSWCNLSTYLITCQLLFHELGRYTVNW